MDLQKFFNSEKGVKLALAIARAIPPFLGEYLAGGVAVWLARRKTQPIVKAVRLNQWWVLKQSDKDASSRALNKQVHKVFTHQASSLYHYYHYIASNRDIRDQVHYTPETEKLIRNLANDPTGTVLISAHTSNFDMALYTIGLNKVDCQVLSFADPTGGYEVQNELRRKSGLLVTPISISSLKNASFRLREGGVVATGAERPLPESKYDIEFFGAPAKLPTGHVRLAMEENVPIRVLYFWYDEEKRDYHLDVSEEIRIQDFGSRNETIIQNTTMIAKKMEAFIAKHPHQWMMFFPVWPEIENQVPD